MTITTTPTTTLPKRFQALAAKLQAQGLDEREVQEALALILPQKRQARDASGLPVAMLPSIAKGLAADLEVEACGMLAEGYTREDLLAPGERRAADRFGDDASTATVITRLGEALASGALPKVRVGKKGGKTASTAIKALRSIRAMMALTDCE